MVSVTAIIAKKEQPVLLVSLHTSITNKYFIKADKLIVSRYLILSKIMINSVISVKYLALLYFGLSLLANN
jgi:hypothetical protein